MDADDGRTRAAGAPDEPAAGRGLTRDQRRGVLVGAVVGLVLGLLLFGGDGRSLLSTAALAVVVAVVAATIGYYVRPVRSRR